MVYRAIGIMSGSSLDGLDIACVELEEIAGTWRYQVMAAGCSPYTPEWLEKLRNAVHLPAREYLLLHSAYGHYIGQQVNAFIEEHGLAYQAGLVASHGHTTFHMPPHMTGQLGCGAAIAAETGLPVVSDLRAVDLAFGGQGAPIVPMGEKLLLGEYEYFLNLGGIANISRNGKGAYIAFDVCPANRVLNMLAAEQGLAYDAGGALAAAGTTDQALLSKLNGQSYYDQPYPKSLANDFGTDILFPMLKAHFGMATPDAAHEPMRYESRTTNHALRTYVEHIAQQIRRALVMILAASGENNAGGAHMLVTGGGAFNEFLVSRIRALTEPLGLETVVPEPGLCNYKEALIMAFLGVLRWREEPTVFSSVTGAREDSIGGALWKGL
jgi:anhydro-N-acetylmuramic acid kinase